jgi:hypothetical protein
MCGNQTRNSESWATHKAANEKEDRHSAKACSICSKPTPRCSETPKHEKSKSRRKHSSSVAQDVYRWRRKSPPLIMAFAVLDIFTVTNFTIAVISGMIGYVVFEYLRRRI